MRDGKDLQGLEASAREVGGVNRSGRHRMTWDLAAIYPPSVPPEVGKERHGTPALSGGEGANKVDRFR